MSQDPDLIAEAPVANEENEFEAEFARLSLSPAPPQKEIEPKETTDSLFPSLVYEIPEAPKRRRPPQKLIDSVEPLVRKEAAKYGIPFNLAMAQLYTESGFKSEAKSTAGAGGIAQFMPKTWLAEGGEKITKKNDPRSDPKKAIPLYAKHMKNLYNRYKRKNPEASEQELWAYALAGYNAGEWVVSQVESGKRGYMPETINYIENMFKRTGGVLPPGYAGTSTTAKKNEFENEFEKEFRQLSGSVEVKEENEFEKEFKELGESQVFAAPVETSTAPMVPVEEDATVEPVTVDPVTLKEVQAEEVQTNAAKAATATWFDKQIAGQAVRENIQAFGRVTALALESQPTSEMYEKVLDILQTTDMNSLSRNLPTALYALNSEESLFTDAVEAIGYLHLLSNNQLLSEEEREEAAAVHNELYRVIESKAEGRLQYPEEEQSPYFVGPPTPPSMLEKAVEKGGDVIEQGVATVFDLIDVAAKGTAKATFMSPEYTVDRPPGTSLKTGAELIRTGGPEWEGVLGGKELAPEKRLEALKGSAKNKNPFGIMAMTLFKSLGVSVGSALAGYDQSFRLLYKLAGEPTLEGYMPSGPDAFPFEVKRKPFKGFTAKDFTDSVKTISKYQDFFTDLGAMILTDPLTFISWPARTIPATLKSLDKIIDGTSLTKSQKDSVKFQMKMAAEDSIRAKNAFVTDNPVVNPGTLDKASSRAVILNTAQQEKIKTEWIKTKKLLEKALKAERTNTLGAREEITRHQNKLNTLNASYLKAASKAQEATASSASYRNFEAKINKPKLSPGEALIEGLDVDVLKTKTRITPVNKLYGELVRIAEKNNIPKKLLEEEFGLGGEFMGSSRLHFFGKELRVPGTGPHAFYRSLRRLGPVFEDVPYVGPKIAASLSDVGSEFKKLRPTGLRVGKVLDPFTGDAGTLQKRARGRQQSLYNVMLARTEENARLMPTEMAMNQKHQDSILEMYIDPNFETYSANGLVVSGRKEELTRIDAPLSRYEADSRFFRGIGDELEEVQQGVREGRIQNERQLALDLQAKPAVTPIGEGVKPAKLPVEYPYVEYDYETMTAKIVKKREPAQEVSNVRGYLDIEDKLTNPQFPRIITAVGFSESAVRSGATTQQSYAIGRNANLESLIDDLISKKKLTLADADKQTIYINTVSANPKHANLPGVPLETTVGDLKRLTYRNVEIEDLGKEWSTPSKTGKYLNPGWVHNYRSEIATDSTINPFVSYLKPEIKKDVNGESFFVRHLPSGNEHLFKPDMATAEWARDFSKMMSEFKKEFSDSRYLESADAVNPISGFYVPRDYSRKKDFDLMETLLTEDIFSSSKATYEKSRIAEFGIPYGDVARLRERNILPEKRIGTLVSQYMRNSSAKLALHELTEATAQLYGIPKSRFMEAYKQTSNGRSAVAVITDATVGSRIKYGKKDIAKVGQVERSGIDDTKFYIERRGNEEWEKFVDEARDSSGFDRKGSKYKIYDSVDGEEYLLPADVANELSIFKDGNTFFPRFISAATNKDNVFSYMLRASFWAYKQIDRAAKRGILVATPSYWGINMVTDTFMVNQHIGKIGVKEFKEAKQFLKDPSSVSFTVEGLGTKIPGSVAMREGRADGHFLNSIARLEEFAGTVDPAKRLELAALRVNGKGLDWEAWEKLIGKSLTLKEKGELLRKSTAATRDKFSDIGLRQGENFVAQWTDLVHAAGYIKSLKKGRSFRQASDDVYGALIDYNDRTRMLNTIRIFAPFGTWAVKSPRSVLQGLARNPKAVSIPVRIQDQIERITIEQEGANLYLPRWMRESGNYRRTPKIFRPLINIGRRLMGGENISETEQLFIKTRFMPVFESLQPFLNVLSGGTADAFVMQLSPALKAVYEVGSGRNLRTMKPFELTADLNRPFARGTPLVPKTYTNQDALIEAALTPDQPAWFSRDMIPYLGALPEVFPGQRMLFTRPGMQAANIAQFMAADRRSDPFIFGAERQYTDPEKGSEALAQTTMGLLTGYTPAVVSEAMALSSMLQDKKVGEKERQRILKEQKALREQFRKALNRLQQSAIRRDRE